MRVLGILCGLLIGSSAFLFGQSMETTSSDTVIAEVGGKKVTLGELEQGMATQLFQARQKYYLAQKDALEQYIDDQLLAAEAKRQNITVDQLLDQNVNQKVQDPTEDQLRVYFEGVNTDQPFEAVREKVLQHIRDGRKTKAYAAYVKTLREKAGVAVTLSAPSADLNAAEATVRGPRNAPVRLVEFGDYQCPYCQQIHPEVNKILAHYGDKVSFAFHDFPLQMHAQAQKAAEAARCAGAQGKYWNFHDALFENGKKLDVPQLKDQAQKLSLDAAKFDKCLDSGEQAGAVAKDAAEARRLGLSGTPTFFINGHLFPGPLKYDALRDTIDKELASNTTSQTANKNF